MSLQQGFWRLGAVLTLSLFSPSLLAQNCSNNQTPVANAGPDRSGNVGVAMNFTGAGTDSDGTITAYWFNFGDGSFTSWQSSPLASHSFASAGTFSVRLWVKDNCEKVSAVDTAMVTITQPPANPCANNTAPIANAGPDRAGNPNVPLLLTGYASTDLQNNISHYWWNYGDGQYTGWQTSAGVSHAFANPGNYSVRLWVKDSCGAMSGADTVIVNIVNPNPCAGNTPPNAVITSPSSGLVNQSLNFSGLSSSDSTGTIQSYSWNFGDGQSANGVNVSHSYASAGNKTVTLTLTDSCGAQGSMTRTIVISNPDPCSGNQPPVAQASANPASANINQAISFSAAGSSDPNGSITSYAWNFGDGSNGSGASASHAYASAGSFNVILTVTDNCGATATKTISVSITNPNQGLTANFEVQKLVHVDVQTGEEAWEAMEPNEQGQIEIELGLRFRLNASFSTGAISYVWRRNNFVIGTTPVLMQQYSEANQIYAIKLTAYGSGGQSANLTKTIHVAAGMQVLSVVQAEDMGITNPGVHGAIATLNNVVWAGDYYGNLSTANITNPANPTPLAHTVLAGAVRDISTDGNLVAAAAGYDGIYLFNAQSPQSLSPLGHYDTYSSSVRPDGQDRYAYGVGIRGNVLYVACGWEIRLINISDPTQPYLMQRLWQGAGGFGSRILVLGNRLIIGASANPPQNLPARILLVDATVPMSPSIEFAIPTATGRRPFDYAVRGNLLAVAEKEGYSWVHEGALSLFNIDFAQHSFSLLLSTSDTDFFYRYRGVTLSEEAIYATSDTSLIKWNIVDPHNIYLQNSGATEPGGGAGQVILLSSGQLVVGLDSGPVFKTVSP